VNLQDPQWAERVAAAAGGPAFAHDIAPVGEYHLAMHQGPGGRTTIELRPRAGRWLPAWVYVPAAERSKISNVEFGPSGMPPATSMTSRAEATFRHNTTGLELAGFRINHAVDALNSVYVHFSSLPSKLYFGPEGRLHVVEWTVS
jgi:hypothetical protein